MSNLETKDHLLPPIKRDEYTAMVCKLVGHSWYSIGQSIYDDSYAWMCRRCPAVHHGLLFRGD